MDPLEDAVGSTAWASASVATEVGSAKTRMVAPGAMNTGSSNVSDSDALPSATLSKPEAGDLCSTAGAVRSSTRKRSSRCAPAREAAASEAKRGSGRPGKELPDLSVTSPPCTVRVYSAFCTSGSRLDASHTCRLSSSTDTSWPASAAVRLASSMSSRATAAPVCPRVMRPDEARETSSLKDTVTRGRFTAAVVVPRVGAVATASGGTRSGTVTKDHTASPLAAGEPSSAGATKAGAGFPAPSTKAPAGIVTKKRVKA
mmetsp:Transcript_18712/g.71165  ORF Transcript_18712/g.71165 Transcript_18712/m.71165 type:complete len:258 (-) Transcript_18712:2739-3512(-)